jgi:hypothetical protein
MRFKMESYYGPKIAREQVETIHVRPWRMIEENIQLLLTEKEVICQKYLKKEAGEDYS